MRATLLLVLLFSAGAAAGAEEVKSPREIAWTYERVVVFKDGFCLVTKRGTAVSDDDGRVFTEEVPDAAVLGTVWATPVEGRLLSMHAGWEETTTTKMRKVAVGNFDGALRANVGKECAVGLTNGDRLAGTIRAVLGTTFLLDDRMHLIREVRTLEIEGMVTETESAVTTTKKAKRLTFRFEGGAARREVRLMYFRPGVRWIPTYRADLPEEGGDRATLSLQAEILNEAEDLIDVPFDLVVGVPNFRFRDVVSPMVLERTLRRAAVAADPRGARFLSNALHTQVMRRNTPPAAAHAPDPTRPGDIRLPEEIRAAGTQDLYVYHLPAMTLRRGHRVAVPIFESRVPFRHVYTFEHHVVHDRSRNVDRRRDASPLVISNQQVWHQLDLTNETKVPWTTGTLLLMRGSQPLAQEMLTYTPPGGRTRVPVTVAVDLRARYSERETKRENGAVRWGGDLYARIDMEGTVLLTNYKAETVEFEVRVRLGGRAGEATMDGEVTHFPFRPEDWRSYRGSPDVNNHSDVRWKGRLEAGKTVRLVVGYHFFVEHD